MNCQRSDRASLTSRSAKEMPSMAMNHHSDREGEGGMLVAVRLIENREIRREWVT